MSSVATSLDDIRAAREVIRGRLHRTPMLTSRILGERAGVQLFLKAENLQKTGSFKVRGVLNKLRHLSDEEKQRGLITISAGNHGQALAYAASVEGLRATIVMPGNARATKVAASKGYGADVVVGGTVHEAFERVEELRRTRALTLVHPYNDPYVIAGQGTVGLEIVEDVPDVDVVYVGIGGGGLISGVAAAIKLSRPGARVIGVEPEGAPTMTEALREHAPVRLETVQTIADGLSAPIVGELTLAAVERFVDEVVLVSDAEIADAMALLLQYAKLLVEPAGAAGLAALLSRRAAGPRGGRTVALLSGGNVDLSLLKERI